MFSRFFSRIFHGPVHQSETLTNPPRIPYVVSYLLVAIGLGLLFPLVSMLYLLVTRRFPITLQNMLILQQQEPLLWIIDTAPLFLGVYAFVLALRESRLRHMFINLMKERENVTELQQLTQQLERRTNQLRAITQLSEQFSVRQDLNELLKTMLEHIRSNFGYYHAHIYLLDDQTDELVVAEGTGNAGAQLKAQRHAIARTAETSLVARAARAGEVVWVDNVRESKDWLPNPLLPHTYAEMAVPVIIDTEVVGVLDVQESRIGAFDEGDASMLTTIAAQIATAIRNIRIFERVDAALAEAKAVQEHYQLQAWDRTRIARRHRGKAVFSRTGVRSLPETLIRQGRQQALSQNKPAVVTVPGDDVLEQALVAPIKIGKIPIGDIQLYGRDTGTAWTDDELQFIEAVLYQVAQAAENLRLFEETQERAGRERLIAEIGDKMRRAPNIETLMRVTVSELERVLGGARTFVKLGTADKLQPGRGVQPADTPSDVPENGRMNGKPAAKE